MSHPPPDSDASTEADADRWDPTFLNTRREAGIIFCVWIAAMLWVIPVSYTGGYSGQELTTVLGIPSWVFYGVAAPWFLCSVFAVWFSLRYMADDDLGEAPEEEGSST